jgi:hypothetical protein
VIEAVEVGMEMGGGWATVSARFALEVLDSIGLKPRACRGNRSGITNTFDRDEWTW